MFTGFLCRTLPYFRDRILADPLFLFKVGAEVVIDSGACCAGADRASGTGSEASGGCLPRFAGCCCGGCVRLGAWCKAQRAAAGAAGQGTYIAEFRYRHGAARAQALCQAAGRFSGHNETHPPPDAPRACPPAASRHPARPSIPPGCATVAEVRKRGKDFWAEFEFYLSDLLVGLVLDVVLVSLMAPAAVLGGVSRAAMSACGCGAWGWGAGGTHREERGAQRKRFAAARA